MKKFLIFSSIGIVVIVSLMALIAYLKTVNTKSLSPEDDAIFTNGDLTVRVFYNRPFKKGREIFGTLVPYGKVWRTGANEATTFETSKDLSVDGKILKKGKYTLWTIPGEENWSVIFNKEHGQWGVNSSGEANRDPILDALVIEVRALKQER